MSWNLCLRGIINMYCNMSDEPMPMRQWRNLFPSIKFKRNTWLIIAEEEFRGTRYSAISPGIMYEDDRDVIYEAGCWLPYVLPSKMVGTCSAILFFMVALRWVELCCLLACWWEMSHVVSQVVMTDAQIYSTWSLPLHPPRVDLRYCNNKRFYFTLREGQNKRALSYCSLPVLACTTYHLMHTKIKH